MRLSSVGYSGVVIYTRNSKCAPIRAEEGITGLLTPPNTSTNFRDLPEEDQIGGYPSLQQLTEAEFDPVALDVEGRCVILEFPAFVLIGTYCPAERDETRTHFRRAFLNILDSRIRNLIAMGKRVVWTGDFNISREEIDTAMSEEMMRKNNITNAEWISSPARRMFNHLLVGGKVHGERDEGREEPVLWDICRAFHEGRKGMYTCWETKVNARPGNYGSRIDYVVCSHDMKDWFCDSNIQEGLMGSDHCPVYAVLKDTIEMNGKETHILDIVNPPGVFENGVRRKEWTTKNLLPMSGKLIQEFDRRRSIRDMFTRKPSLSTGQTTAGEIGEETNPAIAPPSLLPAAQINSNPHANTQIPNDTRPLTNTIPALTRSPPKTAPAKRSSNNEVATPPAKRAKSGSQAVNSNGASKGQQSLKGFFQSKTTPSLPRSEQTLPAIIEASPKQAPATDSPSASASFQSSLPASPAKTDISVEDEASSFATKQAWGKMFARPIAPKCEHDEPCKTMQTKKPGVNCGRSFWMCVRPLGPSGKQEKGTQWRCNTFIWASDWDAHAKEPG